jgi:hypothetical protein
MTKFSNTLKSHWFLRNWNLFVIWILIFGIFSLAFPVHAAILPSCDPVPGSANSCGVEHIFKLLINIYNFLLGLAAVVAILMIIIGGVGLLVYHYFENAEQILEHSKLTVTRAITGIIIITLAYIIVNTTISLLGFNTTSAVGQMLQGLGLIPG